MEREIFENQEIAARMNELLINIKVDREERPDVDHVYMMALQAMTGGGGWPMSVFMTPDRKPFFAATYLPPVAGRGRASFPDILERIAEVWKNERHVILEGSEKVYHVLAQAGTSTRESVEAGEEALHRAYHALQDKFDDVHGGFGSAPKFPRPVALNFLFRYFSRTGVASAREMALTTLQKMAEGGMYDQLGGGFHRYSTDERWHVPHFEKMLYDQAQLAISYLEAYQVTHDPSYKRVAEEILEYVTRDLTHPNGGFFSAEDAESLRSLQSTEKAEGAFYVWTRQEIRSILNADEAAAFECRFGIKEEGNVDIDPRQEFTGQNILTAARSVLQVAESIQKTEDDVQQLLESSRRKLFAQRRTRPRPLLDDKVLLSWNGLMISAFARAYQVLGKAEYAASAKTAAQFVMCELLSNEDGRVLRRYRDGEAKIEAQLSDYSFLVQGLLDLYEASFDIQWLQRAQELTDRQIVIFLDQRQGGFFETSGEDGSILVRTTETYDGAEPSGNSIAILNPLRLSQMLGDQRYEDVARKSLARFGQDIVAGKDALAQLLVALDFSLSKPKQIVIAGSRDDEAVNRMLVEVHSRFMPRKVLLLVDGGAGQRFLASRVPFFGSLVKLEDRATVYVCEDHACKLPTSDVAMLHALLEE